MPDPDAKPTQAEAVPAWKFWHPLPVWHVFLYMFIGQILTAIPIVLLRDVFGFGIPTALIGGGGALFGYLVTISRARKALEQRSGSST